MKHPQIPVVSSAPGSMKRGRGRPPNSSRSPAVVNVTLEPEVKKRRCGRPSKAALEERRLKQEEEAKADEEAELEEQLEAMQQQVSCGRMFRDFCFN